MSIMQALHLQKFQATTISFEYQEHFILEQRTSYQLL